MGKHAGRRLKMVERADLPGRGGGCADIQGRRNRVQPIYEYRLHVDVSVGDDDVLRRQQGDAGGHQRMVGQFSVTDTFGIRQRKPRGHFPVIRGGYVGRLQCPLAVRQGGKEKPGHREDGAMPAPPSGKSRKPGGKSTGAQHGCHPIRQNGRIATFNTLSRWFANRS